MCKVCVKWFHIEGRETCLSLFLTNLVVLEIFFSHPQPSINSRHSLQEKNQGNPAREPTGFLVIRDIGTDLEGVANMLRKIPSKVLRFQEHLRWNHKHMVALVCHQFNNFQRLSSRVTLGKPNFQPFVCYNFLLSTRSWQKTTVVFPRAWDWQRTTLVWFCPPWN